MTFCLGINLVIQGGTAIHSLNSQSCKQPQENHGLPLVLIITRHLTMFDFEV